MELFIIRALIMAGGLLITASGVIILIMMIGSLIHAKQNKSPEEINKQSLRLFGWAQVCMALGATLIAIACFVQEEDAFVGFVFVAFAVICIKGAQTCFSKVGGSKAKSQELERIRTSQADDDDSWNPNET